MYSASLIPSNISKNAIKIPYSAIYALKTRNASTRSPEAIFVEKSREVPIISVTEKENVDMIGPPDPVSNLRPIIRKRLLHETSLQQRLRELQDATQEWNNVFWTNHNKKFVQQRQEYVKSHKISNEENRAMTADEMSEFYKHFLDENWKSHVTYNFRPKLKGPFSPSLGYNREDLYTYLPSSAFDIKLFDDIGNNSKSNIRYTDNAVVLMFQPRYPLVRSWRTSYTLRYTIPAHEFLRRVNQTYVLKMRAVDYTLPDAVVKYAETRVILPTDSELRAVDCGRDGGVEDAGVELLTTALAPKRTAVLLVSKDLVHDTAIPEFTVEYTRCPVRLFTPALYIVGYLEGCFLVYLFASYNWPKLG